MFESALLAKLLTDSIITNYVETYNSKPGIFAEFAPENAEFPYITFRITRRSDDYPAIQKFSVYVDIYDYDKSSKTSRTIAEAVELLLDRCELEHARYSKIRMFFFAGSPVPEEDPRAIHYNLQFEARAGRINFVNNI